MKQLIATTLLGLALAAPDAHADVSAAARAFSDGQAALLEGNYDRAAQSFELAFNIAPSKEALRSAVRARQQSNQLPRAATLAQVLLAQYGDDPSSAKLANDVIAEARPKLARVSVTCSPRCTLALGGRAISLNPAPTQVVFATPGHQVLEITFDGDQSVTRELTLKAGDDLTLPIDPPPVKHVVKAKTPDEPALGDSTSPAPHRDDKRGLPPGVALTGGVITVGLASIAVWSALDTKNAHDAYVTAPTDAGWNDGRSKQLRTNILLGSAVGTGLATGLIAVFWTRWHSTSPPAEVAITPTHGGMTFAFGKSF